MKLDWRYELPQLLVIGAMFVTAAVVWSRVPDRIPIHWNLQGEVDGYGGRFVGLVVLPLVSVVIYLLFLVLPQFDPGNANYAKFAGAYRVIRLTTLLFLAALYAFTILAALGRPIAMGTTLVLLLGVVFVVLGSVMPQIRPNWFIGVRTPWTLSSKQSWEKTHRQAGWVFVAMGVMFALAGISGWNWLFYLAMAAGAVGALWLVVYSYLVYRHDPQRLWHAGPGDRAA